LDIGTALASSGSEVCGLAPKAAVDSSSGVEPFSKVFEGDAERPRCHADVDTW
jgi:hypothetical protein